VVVRWGVDSNYLLGRKKQRIGKRISNAAKKGKSPEDAISEKCCILKAGWKAGPEEKEIRQEGPETVPTEKEQRSSEQGRSM